MLEKLLICEGFSGVFGSKISVISTGKFFKFRLKKKSKFFKLLSILQENLVNQTTVKLNVLACTFDRKILAIQVTIFSCTFMGILFFSVF